MVICTKTTECNIYRLCGCMIKWWVFDYMYQDYLVWHIGCMIKWAMNHWFEWLNDGLWSPDGWQPTGGSYVLLTGCSRRERFRFSLTVSRRQERFGFCLMVGDRRGKFPWRQMKNWHRRSSLTALTVRNQSLTDFRQGKWTFPVSLFLTAYPWRLPSRITFPDCISHFPWRCRPSRKKFPGVV